MGAVPSLHCGAVVLVVVVDVVVEVVTHPVLTHSAQHEPNGPAQIVADGCAHDAAVRRRRQRTPWAAGRQQVTETGAPHVDARTHRITVPRHAADSAPSFTALRTTVDAHEANTAGLDAALQSHAAATARRVAATAAMLAGSSGHEAVATPAPASIIPTRPRTRSRRKSPMPMFVITVPRR
jgi:hypothetical protein